MPTTPHNELKEAIEDALNDVAKYRGVQLGTAAITRTDNWETDDAGVSTGPVYTTVWTTSDQVKALIDASLDDTSPVDPPADPPPSDDPPPVDPPSDPPADGPKIDFVFTQMPNLVGKVHNQSTGFATDQTFNIFWIAGSKASSQVKANGTTTFGYPAAGPNTITVRAKTADGTVYEASLDVVITDLVTPPSDPPPSEDAPPSDPPADPPPGNTPADPPPGNTPPGTSVNGAVAAVKATLADDGVSVYIEDATVKGSQNLAYAQIDCGDPDDPQNKLTIRQNHGFWHIYSKPGTYTITVVSADASRQLCSATTTVEIAGALPEFPTPEAGADDITVVGMVASGETFGYALPPGGFQRIFADGRGGSIKHQPDGAVNIFNAYASCVGDLCIYAVVSQGGKEIFRSNLPLWAHSGANIIWYIEPEVDPNMDMSLVPKYRNGEGVSMAANAQAWDTSPMSARMQRWDMGAAGGDGMMGPNLPNPDAYYFANPTAENAQVVRVQADGTPALPFHVIDDATDKMLIGSDYPNATLLPHFGGIKGNPIQECPSSNFYNLEQGMAHSPIFNAGACLIFGSKQADKDELAQWANFVECLWTQSGYRNEAGAIGIGAGQIRGHGRGLAVLAYASKLTDYNEMFQSWIDGIRLDYDAKYLQQVGIHNGRTKNAGYPHKDYAPWQDHFNVIGIGVAMDFGNADYQVVFNWWAANILDSVLKGPWPIASTYNMAQYRADLTTPVDDWVESLQVEAAHNAKIAAALPLDPASPEFQDALHGPNSGYLPGDFSGYPTTFNGYPSYLGAALAKIMDHGTDQVRAKQAWAIFTKYDRTSFGKNSIAPKTA